MFSHFPDPIAVSVIHYQTAAILVAGQSKSQSKAHKSIVLNFLFIALIPPSGFRARKDELIGPKIIL
jgi:hypothetical protein